MVETQSPVYCVFERPKQGEPIQYAGSVQAIDNEMAMQNARDVYARRPTCVELWIVLRERILTKTIEELENLEPDIASAEGENESYHVFQKLKQRDPCHHVGTVEASDPSRALAEALRRFENPNVSWWWIVPVNEVTTSATEEEDALFEPAQIKWYRDQNSFPVVTILQKLREEADRKNK